MKTTTIKGNLSFTPNLEILRVTTHKKQIHSKVKGRRRLKQKLNRPCLLNTNGQVREIEDIEIQ